MAQKENKVTKHYLLANWQTKFVVWLDSAKTKFSQINAKFALAFMQGLSKNTLACIKKCTKNALAFSKKVSKSIFEFIKNKNYITYYTYAKFYLQKNWRLVLTGLAAGIAGAFLLFALLGWMIEPPIDMGKKSKQMHLSWAKVSKIDDVSTIKRKPEPPETPPPLESSAQSLSNEFSPPAMTALPAISANDISINAAEGESFADGTPGLANLAVGDAEPLLLIPVRRQEPQYPLYALRKGIEGEVEVLFKIDEEGRVIGNTIKVARANPPNVFERVSMRAIRTWRFEPLAQGKKGERLVKYVMYFRLPNK